MDVRNVCTLPMVAVKVHIVHIDSLPLKQSLTISLQLRHPRRVAAVAASAAYYLVRSLEVLPAAVAAERTQCPKHWVELREPAFG